ncbi:unnamed protein product [Brassica rapa subsp. trilocularis]
MWVDMLLIDVNSTIMHATIYDNRLPRFLSMLATGKMFSISGFDGARCAQNYRLTDSPLLLRFSDLTDFDELTEPVSPLPQEGFRFCNHSELAGLAKTNTQLPGGLFLNATSGTHIYFDKETNAGEVYFYT